MGQANSSFVPHPSATVTIPNGGTLAGSVSVDTSTGAHKSQRFAGIPFALPPLGPLRWKRPQPLPAHFRYGDRTYHSFAAQCPEPSNYALTNGVKLPTLPLEQSEDCLYLNIWTPVNPDGSRLEKKLPVLFFIHGGWLQIGHAHLTPAGDPSDLLYKAGLEAVVVTTAYRLNVFGFLAHAALRDEDVDGLTGNYGFWDQRAALEWVYDNIEHFGGDRNNVTVSGLSAGAHSAHSQLLHEWELARKDESYKGVIRRVFLQSNAAVWPSKEVAEVEGQLEELCRLLGVQEGLSALEKVRRLREVEAEKLVEVIPQMDMHTFRATRDEREGAFVKPEWTRAMMDGTLGRWCEQRGVAVLIGECEDEAWVYRYINTPRDERGLVRQVGNYYMEELVRRMLPFYGVKVGATGNKGGDGGGLTEVQGETLYSTLGVKPSATNADIRAAYLAQVRRYHPDKLQQQGAQAVEAATIADIPESDALIRQLNHAYKLLSDDEARSKYDESLAASRACAARSAQPRISATVDFESFQPVESNDVSMRFSYPCRCGYSYTVSEEQVHDRVEVVSCDGCSENIRVKYYEVDEEAGRTEDEVGEIFGRVCSDSQVYIAERMLVTDLLNGGLQPSRIFRYRISYRARILDHVLPSYRGVSHSFDDFLWWLNGLHSQEEGLAKDWLKPWIKFIEGEVDEASKEWYGGKKADGRLVRVLKEDGSVSVESDERWEEKQGLIEAMMQVRKELVQDCL